MQAKDLMTPNPACCTPDDEVAEAARLMREFDCGSLPVVESEETMRLIGIVTDRDLAVRGLTEGKDGETKVSEVMSTDPGSCRPDDDIRDVESVMIQRKVRRVPVVDERGRCVGIIAQADLALGKDAVSNREVGRVVEQISVPSGPAIRRGKRARG
ncbi:MAG: CBS domain-containing protein [Gemmatimonadetes bacterium]|nr:CBS domain-containing protein [Gemmatimonadota bacterium]